jgi:hypothetical protein
MMNDPPAPNFLQTAIRRAFSTGLVILTSYTFIDVSYWLAAIALTAVGLTNATSWPPLFGKFSEMRTVRGAWGYILFLSH